MTCEIIKILGDGRYEVDCNDGIKRIGLCRSIIRRHLNIQPGDVEITYADIEYSKNKLGYEPRTSISKGIPKFIDWYKDYNK